MNNSLWIRCSQAARFRETATSGNEPESSLTPCCQRDGWDWTEDAGKWNVQLLGLMAAWCEAPHPCFNWLFVSSSRWGKEGWLSQLTCWLWVALPSRIALYLLQPIDPAADFRHHWILLQMNSEIIQASPIVVTELNSTIETIFLATPLSWVPQGKGGGEKKAPKACLPPFSSF